MNPPRDAKVDREINRDVEVDNLRRLVAELLDKTKETNGDLTEDEVKAIRAILKRSERIAGFWSTVRLWGSWIAGIVGSILFIQEYGEKIAKAIKWIFR